MGTVTFGRTANPYIVNSSSPTSAMPDDSDYIPGTHFEKVSKLLARYVEFSEFKDADMKRGYFCHGCVYFFRGRDECAIVQSKGESADGENSDRIAPHGMCALWKNLAMMKKQGA